MVKVVPTSRKLLSISLILRIGGIRKVGFLDAGMDDYISKHIHENSKPMKIEELVGALCKYPSIRNKNISSLGSCSPP
jgi:hypothetical protein